MNHLADVDRIYLARACELAARGIGNVSPNPPVGAVIVSAAGRIIGEGYHHRRGEAHAEVEALRNARELGHAEAIAGATMYVTLEPCNHHGRTPPCSEAVVAAGVARVVVGAVDPNPRTALGGIARLEDAKIAVDIIGDATALELIRMFTVSVRLQRPYVTLKMAASLDGRIGPEPGSFWLTGPEARSFVQDLRSRHDAVMVGAHTIAVDDPLLTIRPARNRRRMFTRIVVCGATPPSRDANIFSETSLTTTILCVPGRFMNKYTELENFVELHPVGDEDAHSVDIATLLSLLHKREIASILCEGGPTLAGSLLGANVVDRMEWLVAPKLLSSASAPSALNGEFTKHLPKFHFNTIQRIGDDLRVTIDL